MQRILATSLLVLAAIAFSPAAPAWADEPLKFRLIVHATAAQSQDVGDIEGHTMSVGRLSGLATFPDGSVGTANATVTSDYIKGRGTFSAYFNLTTSDGSTITWKGSGEGIPNGKATIFPEFPISVLNGTGRFEGAKGEGSQKAERLTPLAAGADLYADVVLNVAQAQTLQATKQTTTQAMQQVDQQTMQQIEMVGQKWVEASNKGDGQAVNALFTKNGYQISVRGKKNAGSEMIQNQENVHKLGLSIAAKSTDIRLLPGGQTALEAGTYEVNYTNDPTTTTAHGNWMRVLVREGSDWKIEAQGLTREQEPTSTGSTTKQ
jgi:uncharacterized protein (TIGR02246 family)